VTNVKGAISEGVWYLKTINALIIVGLNLRINGMQNKKEG